MAVSHGKLEAAAALAVVPAAAGVAVAGIGIGVHGGILGAGGVGVHDEKRG